MEAIDGIYIGFMSGEEGHGLAMFVFQKGAISGADAAGVQFDGSYKLNGVEYICEVSVSVPGDITVVQGASAGPSGLSYQVQLTLPINFTDDKFHRLETPLGPVNLSLKKLRALEA